MGFPLCAVFAAINTSVNIFVYAPACTCSFSEKKFLELEFLGQRTYVLFRLLIRIFKLRFYKLNQFPVLVYIRILPSLLLKTQEYYHTFEGKYFLWKYLFKIIWCTDVTEMQSVKYKTCFHSHTLSWLEVMVENRLIRYF